MKTSKLSLFDLTMIVVGLVVGMGIFRTASVAAKDALTPGVYFGAWIFAGIIALCGALTYAEIGSRYPITGGYYRIFSYAYHPALAFSVNCLVLVSNAASLAGVALIGSGYVSKILFNEPASDTVKVVIAIAAVLLFYVVNLFGLRMSSKTQNVLMIIKLGMVLMLIGALFMPSTFTDSEPIIKFAENGEWGWMDYVKSFGITLMAVSFTYGGYQQTINFGSEIENPKKNIPIGIVSGIIIIIVLYMLVNLSYYKVVGFNELKNTGEIATVVISKMFGEQGGIIFSGLLVLSVLAYVNVVLLSNPRVMFAMSEDGVLPAVFKKRWEKRGVLFVSLTTFTAICMVVLFYAKTFDKILGFTMFLDCFGMALSAGAIFLLRKRKMNEETPGIYKMKFYPFIPALFIAAYAFIAISIMISETKTAMTGLAVLAGFVVLYFITQAFKKKN
ncbi:APC family permease [Gynurincola endophyticus]|jgi:APA family basic amino acid/polyamine antiporter|uniref:APC family permease n=1 Tax=Gynurincola endophyticus TaxID=2479004 RepID=UPI000F8D6F34|nr:APC family permease [Gynurincola endophyticus]